MKNVFTAFSRPDKKQRMVNIESSRHRKQEQKHPQPQPYKREGKWHKYGRIMEDTWQTLK